MCDLATLQPVQVLQKSVNNVLLNFSACAQDSSKRKAVDDAREDARLFKIASELADEEERKRQWRVARGEVNPIACC